jgi:hypothetical protein
MFLQAINNCRQYLSEEVQEGLSEALAMLHKADRELLLVLRKHSSEKEEKK